MTEEFERPHEWAMEEDGSVEYFEMGSYHGGPKCISCSWTFCQHCQPGIFTETCTNQDEPFSIEVFTKVQRDARLRRMNKLGYILKSGIVVGWREPTPECKPSTHKWTPIKKRTPENTTRIRQCVVCDKTETD